MSACGTASKCRLSGPNPDQTHAWLSHVEVQQDVTQPGVQPFPSRESGAGGADQAPGLARVPVWEGADGEDGVRAGVPECCRTC